MGEKKGKAKDSIKFLLALLSRGKIVSEEQWGEISDQMTDVGSPYYIIRRATSVLLMMSFLWLVPIIRR